MDYTCCFRLAFTSTYQLVCALIYMMFIVYFMSIEIRSLIRLRWSHFRSFWSYIDLGIIVCSWTSVGVYIWRYREASRIGDLFQAKHGYTFINLQRAVYINETLTFLLAFCCFFGSLKFLRLGRFLRRLSLFVDTIRYAAKELVMFTVMFAIVFMAFLMLFYLLFNESMLSCSTLLHTAQMLFEIMLMKFDAQQLQGAAAFLGPFCFTLFVLLVVFVCMSMFITIISDSFRLVRDNSQTMVNEDELVLRFAKRRVQRILGLRQQETLEEADARLRLTYRDPIEQFPDKIEQLFQALNRVRSVAFMRVRREPCGSLQLDLRRSTAATASRASNQPASLIFSMSIDSASCVVSCKINVILFASSVRCYHCECNRSGDASEQIPN